MVVKLITYATHSYGTFEDIINNEFGIDIIVLGWNQKWNGFMDKFKGIRNYIDILDDNDIIIFIDGFDSNILQSLEEAVNRFKKLDCKVLLSEVPKYQRDGIFKYFSSKTTFYEKLNNLKKIDSIANSGLYMGYVKELKLIFDRIFKECYKCKDDQRNLNNIIEHFDFIKIDKEQFVFSNDNNMDACFIQNPGKISTNRISRGIREYSQYFLFEIFVLFLILFIIFKKFRKYIFVIYLILMILFIIFADHSCTF